jgi:hypothetical protein
MMIRFMKRDGGGHHYKFEELIPHSPDFRYLPGRWSRFLAVGTTNVAQDGRRSISQKYQQREIYGETFTDLQFSAAKTIVSDNGAELTKIEHSEMKL